jgi:hypothetical protein
MLLCTTGDMGEETCFFFLLLKKKRFSFVGAAAVMSIDK